MNGRPQRRSAAVSNLIRSFPAVLCVSACVHQAGRPGSAPVAPSAPAQATAPAAPASPPQSSNAPPTASPHNALAETQSPPTQATAANVRPAGTAPKSPATSPRPATAPRAPQPAPAQPALTGPPALDLKALEQRLRDTSAIGVFTKLTLKNQVDDLLAQFKAFHEGRSQATLAQLRQKYEELLLKVVSLLQDGDPALASAISASREAIWNVLTDPKKFANI